MYTAYLGQLGKVDGFLGAGKTCRTLQRVQTEGQKLRGPDVAMGAGAGSPAELHCYCALYAYKPRKVDTGLCSSP